MEPNFGGKLKYSNTTDQFVKLTVFNKDILTQMAAVSDVLHNTNFFR
jgi:hypothetical protein